MPRGLPVLLERDPGPKVKTMIACAQCRTTNTLDSTFCRRCGAALAADVLVEARAELDALVAKGTAAFEDERVDDAMAIAEEAVLTDPAHANAHALKGMIHERRGEIAKALEEYERVCDLSPDSALDRIRLSGLRSALAERATATPDRRTPLLAGISAAVLLACVGIAAAKMTTPAKPVVDANAVKTLVASTDVPASESAPTTSNIATSRPNTTLQPGDVPPLGANSPTVTETPAASGGASGASLPRPRYDRRGGLSGDPSSIEISPMPVNPGQIGSGAIGSGVNGQLPSAGGPSFPSQPRKTPIATSTPLDREPGAGSPTGGAGTWTPGTSTPTTPRATGRKDNGVIDIQIEKGTGPANPSGGASSAPETSANGAEALTRVGKAHAQGGDFDRAAKAYERALAAGADPAATNQRLAQAYDRMGRKADAKAAYGRAADGYRRKMSSGKADDRDRNGLDSVTQAMKVLDRG